MWLSNIACVRRKSCKLQHRPGQDVWVSEQMHRKLTDTQQPRPQVRSGSQRDPPSMLHSRDAGSLWRQSLDERKDVGGALNVYKGSDFSQLKLLDCCWNFENDSNRLRSARIQIPDANRRGKRRR